MLALVFLLCLVELSEAQLTEFNSVILQGLENYADIATNSFGLVRFGAATGRSNTTSIRASMKASKNINKKQNAALAKHPELLRSLKPQASSCVNPNTAIIFNGAKVLGQFVQATGNVFVDNNADGDIDTPEEIEFLFEPQNYFFAIDNPAADLDDTTSVYDIVLSTNDIGFRRMVGSQPAVVGSDPTTGAPVRLLPIRFAVPELLSSSRFAPFIVTPTDNGPIRVAVDLSARTGNISCSSPSTNVDIGYLNLQNPVPNHPNAVGGYNQGFTAAGTNQRLHLLTVFVDENADNMWNPFERYVSAAAILARQNNASVPAAQRPFVISPTPGAGFTVTYTASPTAGDDTSLMVTIVGSTPFGDTTTEIILRPEFLGNLLPVCGPSSSTVIVGKNIQLSTATPAQTTTDYGSYFVGTAQRLVLPVVAGSGTNATTAGAARPYVSYRFPATGADLITPALRSTNQFPLQCIEDSTINSPRQTSLGIDNANNPTSAFRLITGPSECTGISGAGRQMTLGTNVSCPMQICFFRQNENVTRFYEQARLMTFATIITNATQSTIISAPPGTTYVDIGRYSLSLARGPLTNYSASTQILSSGMRKITFTHSLQRNTIASIPAISCMVLNYNIDYTQCSVGGQNMLIELSMLSGTMPFPDFSIAARTIAISLTQDPACVSFVPPSTTAPTSTPTTSPTGPINQGSDNTLAFLLIVFFVILLLSCCIWFYIY